MSRLKVFISSTCYDLGMVRSELREFISNFGHEPVMSEYNDILFNPKEHTHENCIREIVNSDVIILIIGSRYGGKALPQVINQIDIEKIKTTSKGNKMLENPENISITQVEILKAIGHNIPIYTFVDSKVLNDHLLYEKNKDKEFINKIDFASIEKKETAIYIFEFINFIRLRSKNNSIFEFSKISDIEEIIKHQWSSLLQNFLSEERKNNQEKIQENIFIDGINDIKSLLITTISSVNGKDIGKGVLRYRKVIEFLIEFKINNINQILLENLNWSDLLKRMEIKEIAIIDNSSINTIYMTYFIKNDDTYYICRYTISMIQRIADDWEIFKDINFKLKESIIESISESLQQPFPVIKYKNTTFKTFKNEIEIITNGNIKISIINPKTLTRYKRVGNIIQTKKNNDDNEYIDISNIL